ncbi:MAG: Ion-translocating oxidoreductase complex subunit G [Sodalis sp.]|nr:MAG: Ion-translocating oxidoreductase complex subunit G [Sodalis sp.]
MRKHGITLIVFTTLAIGLTALVNSMTTSAIKQRTARQKMQLFYQVLPPNLYNNQPLDECYAAAVESTALDGYSGAIELRMAMSLGARVTHHHETLRLGDKIELFRIESPTLVAKPCALIMTRVGR